MGLAESIVSSTLAQRGSRAYVPYALLTVGIGGFFYGIPIVASLSANLSLVTVAFVVGFLGIVTSDLSLNEEISKILNFDEVSKRWKAQTSALHEILSKSKNFLDDIRASEQKMSMVRKFLPIFIVRVGGFYLAGLALLFAANDMTASGSQNFLQSLGFNRMGFFLLFAALACASSVLINVVEVTAPERKDGDLGDLGRQMLSSYFLDNVREASPNLGMIYRALLPLVAIQMLIRIRPLRTIAGLFQFDNFTRILEEEIGGATLEPIKKEDFTRLKTIKEDGLYEKADSLRVRHLPLLEVSSLEIDRFLDSMLTGEELKGSVSCRFRLKTKKGLVVVAALMGCFSRFREIRFEGGRTVIREESEPRTIFYILGVGEKSTLIDLELKLTMKAKKLSGSELSPCKGH